MNVSGVFLLALTFFSFGCGESSSNGNTSLSGVSDRSDVVQKLAQINEGILGGVHAGSKSLCSIEVRQTAHGVWEARFIYVDVLNQKAVDETIPVQKFDYHGVLPSIQSGWAKQYIIGFSETGVFEDFSVWDWRGNVHVDCRLPAYAQRKWDPIP